VRKRRLKRLKARIAAEAAAAQALLAAASAATQAQMQLAAKERADVDATRQDSLGRTTAAPGGGKVDTE
jgi:hypothetical protein